VKSKRYDGIDFYRAVRTPGAPDTGFIQGGAQGDPKRVLPPIKLEPTTQTGLHHQDGTITMARLAPNSATSDFVIMVGPNASYMDANPAAPGDNLGYAAFGKVVDGMDVVKKILALPSEGHARNPVMKGQILDPPVRIISARVEP
jgi:peptidyl-prolyl cis-trans isomerase A (cyclophilin A)